MDIKITDSNLARLVKIAEQKPEKTAEEAEVINASLDDLRLQKRQEGMSNSQFYRWLEQQ